MQVVAVNETKKTKGCFAKAPATVVAKVEKWSEEGKEPIIFGDLDDMIRVARYKVHELCYALPSEMRTIISKIESDIEILKLKGRAPTGFGVIMESPPILASLEELIERLRVIQGPELTEAKKRFGFLMDEREFVLQRNKK